MLSIYDACKTGNVVCVRQHLASKMLKPNAPDSNGRSAIFYAQVHGHRAVVDLLVVHGWTKMPEGNMSVGPGGRKIFWEWCEAANARKPPPPPPPPPVEKVEPPSESESKTPSNAARPSARKEAVRERRLERESERQGGLPDHPLYARKEARSKGGKGKPTLNTRADDEWRMHVELEEEQEVRRLLTRADVGGVGDELSPELLARCLAVRPVAAQAPYAPPRSLGATTPHAVALESGRVVASVTPTLAADGSWVVVQKHGSPEQAIFEVGNGAGRLLSCETRTEHELLEGFGGEAEAEGEEEEEEEEEVDWPSLATGGGGSARSSERPSLTPSDASEDDDFMLVERDVTGDWEASAPAADASAANATASPLAAWSGGAAKTLAAVGPSAALAVAPKMPVARAGDRAGWRWTTAAKDVSKKEEELEEGWVGCTYPKDASHRLHGSKSKNTNLVLRRQARALERRPQPLAVE